MGMEVQLVVREVRRREEMEEKEDKRIPYPERLDCMLGHNRYCSGTVSPLTVIYVQSDAQLSMTNANISAHQAGRIQLQMRYAVNET